MSEIKLNKDEKDTLVKKIQMYFNEELDYSIGQFDAEFFLDFLSAELGPVFYNQGLYDAQAMLEKQIEYLGESIYALQKPISLR